MFILEKWVNLSDCLLHSRTPPKHTLSTHLERAPCRGARSAGEKLGCTVCRVEMVSCYQPQSGYIFVCVSPTVTFYPKWDF